jgi:hypothetical protein
MPIAQSACRRQAWRLTFETGDRFCNSPLEGMIAAAEARGYEYYAVTGHAPNLVMQRMTDEKMLAQRDQLRALADTTGMVLPHGTKLNIAPDGSVDWDEDFPRGLDICVASVQTETPNPKLMSLTSVTAGDGVAPGEAPRWLGTAPASRACVCGMLPGLERVPGWSPAGHARMA